MQFSSDGEIETHAVEPLPTDRKQAKDSHNQSSQKAKAFVANHSRSTFLESTMTPILLATAARELEDLKQREMKKQSKRRNAHVIEHSPFPPACLCLLRSVPGNTFCVECGALNPQWATLSYGALVCLKCSGKHRRLGVQVRRDIS